MKFTVEGIAVGFEKHEPPSTWLYCKADPTHEHYEWLCENVFSYDIDGVKYFAPGATGRGLKTPENPQGPLINTSMAWKTGEQDIAIVTQYAEYGEMVKWEEVKALLDKDNMTAEEYRKHVAAQLEAESKPGKFTFPLNIKGKDLIFSLDDSDRIDVIGQFTMGQTEVEIHDMKRENSETYDQVEAMVIMTALATVTREHKYPIDAKIKALYQLPEGFSKEDVDAI